MPLAKTIPSPISKSSLTLLFLLCYSRAKSPINTGQFITQMAKTKYEKTNILV